jgi:hypothetical protein
MSASKSVASDLSAYGVARATISGAPLDDAHTFGVDKPEVTQWRWPF